MQKKRKDGMLSDDQLAGVSGGSVIEVDSEKMLFPEQLQCTKCGRMISKEEFFAVQKCPDCGGGMFKAVRGS